jgi:hypothetical protein
MTVSITDPDEELKPLSISNNGHNGKNHHPDTTTLKAMMSINEPQHQWTFQPLTLEDLLNLPPKEWIVDQVIGRGDLAMIYGPPGSGKTFVLIDFIFSACLKQTWAGRFAVERPLTIAYCAGEGVSGLPGRFQAAQKSYNSYLPNFQFFRTVPSLFYGDAERAHVDSIEQFILEWQQRQQAGQTKPLDILIVDTLHSASTGADENSAKDMGRVLQLAKMAATKLGCAVILVHHANKAGTGERGSSSLRGAMDTMIEISPTAGKFAMECAKLKDGDRWKTQTFSLVGVTDTDSVRVWWDEDADNAANRGNKQDADQDAIVKLLQSTNARLTAGSISEAIGTGESTQVYKLLNKLVNDKRIKRELSNPKKKESNRNPWVYFIH